MAVTRTRIWLTTLAAVDAGLGPPQQVADHPADPATPVWVFVVDGHLPGILYADESETLVRSAAERRMLYVADASDPRTRDGAFVYIYGWSELGDPRLPTRMPPIGTTP